jgi:hypothetical protein
MIAEKITPKLILIAITLQAGVWLGWHLPVLLSGDSHRQQDSESYVFGAISIVGYILAFIVNLQIAEEYKDNALMRSSWMLLAANALISVGREFITLPVLNLIWTGYVDSAAWGLHHQLFILTANTTLLLGLVGMWWSYRKTGLGFVVGKRDYAEILVILALTFGLLVFSEGMTEGASPYLVSRILQPLGLVILGSATVASIVLYRMAIQMGGGKLALAIRFLTLYTLLRATLVLLEAMLGLTTPVRRAEHDILMFIDLLCWRAVPWIAVLAAVYRAELTVQASRKLKNNAAPEVRATVSA